MGATGWGAFTAAGGTYNVSAMYEAASYLGEGFPGHPVGCNSSAPEWTFRFDYITTTPETLDAWGWYQAEYAVTASLYVDPQNNALRTDPATFVDGERILTMAGTAHSRTMIPMASLVNGTQTAAYGGICYAFPDAGGYGFSAYTTAQGAGQSDWTIFADLMVPGDCDLDGWVTARDYAQMDAAYLLGTNATWTQGDFDGNGRVTAADYTLALQANARLPPVTVPEPGTLALMVLGLMLRRRR